MVMGLDDYVLSMRRSQGVVTGERLIDGVVVELRDKYDLTPFVYRGRRVASREGVYDIEELMYFVGKREKLRTEK